MKESKAIIKLDPYEYGAVLMSLVEERNSLIRNCKATDTIDRVIVKLNNAKKRDDRERERDDSR
jgi:hypothetical protein